MFKGMKLVRLHQVGDELGEVVAAKVTVVPLAQEGRNANWRSLFLRKHLHSVGTDALMARVLVEVVLVGVDKVAVQVVGRVRVVVTVTPVALQNFRRRQVGLWNAQCRTKRADVDVAVVLALALALLSHRYTHGLVHRLVHRLGHGLAHGLAHGLMHVSVAVNAMFVMLVNVTLLMHMWVLMLVLVLVLILVLMSMLMGMVRVCLTKLKGKRFGDSEMLIFQM